LNRFETVQLVGFDPADMHALVADVASYPRFLPWVKAARLWDRQDDGTGASRFKAEVLVGFKAFRAPFATTVETDPQRLTIATALIRGPFKVLECQWRFSGIPGACQVAVAIDYQFSDPILQALLGANIDKAVSRLVSAFTAEAERRYKAAQAS
jgi:coenzyme Q-binding protein COQ10